MSQVPARVLACPNCGAPLGASDAGGATTCTYCNVTSLLGARPGFRLGKLVLPDPASPAERARVAQLHAVAKTFDWNKDRFSLNFAPKGYDDVEGFDVTRETAQRLETDFRAAVADRDSVPERTLWWLAERLVNLWNMRKDFVRARAIAQTASEVLTDARFKQTMFAALAIAAMRDGDFVAAETWLVQCDPCSPELGLDNDFRLAVARLALQRQDPRMALAVVGDVATTFAWSPQCGPLAALLRTAAHELRGHGPTADEELRSIIERIAERTIQSNAHLDPEEIRAECVDNARMWAANTLDRSPHLAPALGVWNRLAAAGELPPHAETVKRFHAKFG
jgi:hypothetical protein